MSKRLTEQTQKRNYITVLSDGTFRLSVPEGSEGSIKREYETSTGEKGVKYERVYQTAQGLIEDISFIDTDYGESVVVTLTGETEGDDAEITIMLNTTSPFGEDFLKKLPNINFQRPVLLRPYSFTDEKTGKPRKGIAITQGENKIVNFFFDIDKKKTINGYPEPEGDVNEYDKEDWKIYFLKARKFVVKYAKEKVELPKKKEGFEILEGGDIPETGEEINPEDIPF